MCKIIKINKCAACMNDIEEGTTVCPFCKFDVKKERQPEWALPWNTILYGKYLVGNVLGQGGFGITYIGFDMKLNIRVAIKEFFPSGSAVRNGHKSSVVQWPVSKSKCAVVDNYEEIFLKEAREMAKIDNIPGIVRVRDTFVENATAYIVMDYVDGKTLKEVIKQDGVMNPRNCVEKMLPLLKGISSMHALNMIHRDISPDNIMITLDGQLRLLDFGAAKDISLEKNKSSMMIVRHGYSPCELYMEEEEPEACTDVYSVCATMYYCIYKECIPNAMNRVVQDTLIYPQLKGEGTEELRNILKKGLAVKKNDRIQTMDELIERLEAIKWNKKNKLWVFAVGGVGATVLAVSIALFAHGVTSRSDEDAETQLYLAESDQNGDDGNGQDNEKASDYYEKAAEQGNAVTQYELGTMYYEGKGREKNHEKAFEWYEKAAEQGYDKAQFSLGQCYYYGDGIEQNYEKAFEWYQKASDQKNAVAKNEIGVMYFYGQGVEVDYEKAMKYFLDASNWGDVLAKGNIGILYENGFGVEKDEKEAVYWYQKAAESGDKWAMEALSRCYQNGIGVTIDGEKAEYWKAKAVEADE